MLRMLSLAYCAVFVVGCVQSEASDNNVSRFVTTVTWDASHRPLVATREVRPDSIGRDPLCQSGDLKISDKPLVPSGAGGGGGYAGFNGSIDPTSNVLCLADPGDSESISLRAFSYPVGTAQTWAHHVVGYVSAGQGGGFFNDGQDKGIASFDFSFASDTSETLPVAIQNANGVEFDAVNAPAQCPNGQYQCVGTVLQHCDGASQWQTSVDCASEGLVCQAGGCTCAPPTCGASCGVVTNACGVSVDCGGCQGYAQRCVDNQCRTTCHCAKGFVCDPDGACIRL